MRLRTSPAVLKRFSEFGPGIKGQSDNCSILIRTAVLAGREAALCSNPILWEFQQMVSMKVETARHVTQILKSNSTISVSETTRIATEITDHMRA